MKLKTLNWKLNYDNDYYLHVGKFIVVIFKDESEKFFRWSVGTIDFKERYENPIVVSNDKHWDNGEHHIGIELISGKAKTLPKAKVESLDFFKDFLEAQMYEFEEAGNLQYDINEEDKKKK